MKWYEMQCQYSVCSLKHLHELLPCSFEINRKKWNTHSSPLLLCVHSHQAENSLLSLSHILDVWLPLSKPFPKSILLLLLLACRSAVCLCRTFVSECIVCLANTHICDARWSETRSVEICIQRCVKHTNQKHFSASIRFDSNVLARVNTNDRW